MRRKQTAIDVLKNPLFWKYMAILGAIMILLIITR